MESSDLCSPALLEAVERSDLTALRESIRHGSNVNASTADGVALLSFALEKKATADVITELLGAGASLRTANARGEQPIHFAARAGHMEGLRLLLRGGADANATTTERLTPLFLALAAGHNDVARELLSAGARADSGGYEEGVCPPLIALAQHGDVGMAQELLQAGAKPNEWTANDPQQLADRIIGARALLPYLGCRADPAQIDP